MTDAQWLLIGAGLIFGAAIFGVVKQAGNYHGLPMPEDREWTGENRRKRDAKLWNEQLKLVATLFNGIGVATVVAIWVTPAVRGDSSAQPTLGHIIAALLWLTVLHIFAQLVLRLWRSEE